RKEGDNMANGFTTSRVGHDGIQVIKVGRSVQWHSDIRGLTLRGRWAMGENAKRAFMRFNEDHHKIVLFTHPGFTEVNRNAGYNSLQHMALEVEIRDEWLKALAELRRKGVEIVQAPLIHGPEGGRGRGNAFGGSGSRSFYFLDPDGNRLEIYTDMMK